MYSRNRCRVRQVEYLESRIIRTPRQPPPYLDQTIIRSCRGDQFRIRRELCEFNRVGKLLSPYQTRAIVVQEPER